MAWLKKNPETEGQKPAPQAGVRLGEIISNTAKTSQKPDDPGRGMGYQDKEKQVPMQSQTPPQFVHNTQAPVSTQTGGLTQPTRPKHPGSFNQPPMQPAGMLTQPTRPNLGQPVRPTNPPVSVPTRAPAPVTNQGSAMLGSDIGKGQVTKADNISRAARRVPVIGMPFPGCHGIGDRISYAAFVIQPCKWTTF